MSSLLGAENEIGSQKDAHLPPSRLGQIHASIFAPRLVVGSSPRFAPAFSRVVFDGSRVRAARLLKQKRHPKMSFLLGAENEALTLVFAMLCNSGGSL